MTRTEILNQYRVNPQGIIISPGKFEGNPVYVPHFWDMALSGMCDYEEFQGEKLISIFYPDEMDKSLWPELANVTRLALVETDTGFVNADIQKKGE